MAITDNIYQEAMVGDPLIRPAQGIYEESSTQKAPLGTRLAFSDGRVYRYALNGSTALAAGKPVKSLASGSDLVNLLVQSAAAIGTKTVTVSTAAAMTTLAEGYLCINDNTGQGLMYKIKKSAANASTSTHTDITLYDPIYTALDTTSECIVVPSPYYGVTVATADGEENIIGVPPIAVTASYYFWLQTWGICNVLRADTAAVGNDLTTQTTTANAVGERTAGTSNTGYIGHGWGCAGVATEYRPVMLRIAP